MDRAEGQGVGALGAIVDAELMELTPNTVEAIEIETEARLIWRNRDIDRSQHGE